MAVFFMFVHIHTYNDLKRFSMAENWRPGTDIMILKIFSPKFVCKKWDF
jgi:hypothetical protein